MYYLLDSDIALRSWHLVPYACYIRGVRNARRLTKEEFEFLSLCDGQHDLGGALAGELVRRGFISECRDRNKTLASWQKMSCDNRYFPAMNWMITGKCNYNCLHCFNAADNAPLMSEFTLEEAERLLDEAQICGINAFTITGGEPMCHRNFFDIIEGIYRRGMFVEELNTNGCYITEQTLERMRRIGCRPLVKISFDGVGHHDWLRNRRGAEEDALRAIRLCVEHGFRVRAQTNVHRLNVDSMLETAKRLGSMGVAEMRVIRTSEAPRWVRNAGNACLTLEEYFDAMLDFLRAYADTGLAMEVDVWQFAHICPRTKAYRPRAVECGEGDYRDSLPVCRGNRGMVAVAANGELYPCHQMSGYYEQHGWSLGNVKADGLQRHLQSGAYLGEVCATVRELAGHNAQCAACRWFRYCCGGCRAIGLALTGDRFGADPSKCLFFNGGYLQRLQSALRDYSSISQISCADL